MIKVCFSNEKKKLSLFPWDPPCHWKKMTLQGLYIAIDDTVCVKACFYEAQKVFSRVKATQVLLATLFCCCWGHLFSRIEKHCWNVTPGFLWFWRMGVALLFPTVSSWPFEAKKRVMMNFLRSLESTWETPLKSDHGVWKIILSLIL